jgi:hypothetical protein
VKLGFGDLPVGLPDVPSQKKNMGAVFPHRPSLLHALLLSSFLAVIRQFIANILMISFVCLLIHAVCYFCLCFQISSVEAVHRFFEKFPGAFMDKLHVAVPKRFVMSF